MSSVAVSSRSSLPFAGGSAPALLQAAFPTVSLFLLLPLGAHRLLCPRRVSFCAEHARRNALALQAQLKKSNPGPVSETLLCQLSSYARTELGSHSTDSGRSEASRILGERRGLLLSLWSCWGCHPVMERALWVGPHRWEVTTRPKPCRFPLLAAAGQRCSAGSSLCVPPGAEGQEGMDCGGVC